METLLELKRGELSCRHWPLLISQTPVPQRGITCLNKRVAGMTALGRVGEPDDIGPMVASLLSDDNRWVTGQRIEVSGGMGL